MNFVALYCTDFTKFKVLSHFFMRNTLFSILFCGICLVNNAQKSDFLGYFSPMVSHLIPVNQNQIEPKNQLIKPNFKGRDLIEVDNSNSHNPDWVWQQHQSNEKSTSATINWQFQGLGTNLSPPDPTVDADSSVVIQSTNGNSGGVYRIFNKATGATILNSATMQTLGGPSGAGDPIVLYYKPARKWFLTEFSSSGNRLLIHVSQTSNPQGAYWTYTFTCNQFPDYPKYSFCPSSDAFLVSTNEGSTPKTYAMRLSTLLSGGTSPFIKVSVGYGLNGFGFQSITPVDIEGDNPAPSGMKPLFVRHRDDESHSNGSPDSGTNDWIELWEMSINWDNNTATIAKIQDIAIAEIDSKLCGLTSFQCIKQPGTTNTLDPLRETVMFKAPMRVFDDHQSLLLSLSTDVNGADRSGVRWIELRRAAGAITPTWTKYQEGTYAPGTSTSRWMPGINMDKYGNILLAYSTSSNTAGDFPSLKMTGRRPCDPLGTMTMPETTIVAGTSSKSGDTRWGDYHHLSIDDFDGKTFYFTGVYHNTNTKTNVSSIRINPFSLDAAIVGVFRVSDSSTCGSATNVGVIIENQGTSNINNGTFSWQIGSSNATEVQFASSQLTAGNRDTIFCTIIGLVNGLNNVSFSITQLNNQADENLCNDTKVTSIEMGQANYFNVSSSVNIVPSCVGNDGSISLTVAGGTAPYTFSLNNGPFQTDSTFNDIPAGEYSYQIADSTGCLNSGSFVLDPAASIAVLVNNSSEILCNGQTATVNLTATGGQASYSYSIDGINYQNSNVISNLSAGNYTFYSKDTNGCVGTIDAVISEPSALSLNVIPTMVSCYGSANGSLLVSGSGGVPPYEYSADGITYFNSNTLINLAPGNYTVHIRDVNDCIKTFNTTITQPDSLEAIGVSTSATNGSNGTITLSGTGGLTPYTYSLNGTNYFSGSLFSNLLPGTYTGYVKDNNGCVSSVNLFVNDNNSSISELAINVLKLYPNPNEGIFELELSGLKGNQVELKFFNVSGQLVSSIQLPIENGELNKTIEMSSKLSSGFYYLGIYSENHAAIVTIEKY
jgi:hypothetical protein